MKQEFLKNPKVVLLILDGWGLGREDAGNAISLAKTPTMDLLYKKYPWTKLCAAGRCVGLPDKQVGNSEAGHINLGAGRIVDQDVVRISKQINSGEFFKNPAFLAALNQVKKEGSALHLMGLLSSGQSPHSDPDHLYSLLILARKRKIKKVYLHLFTDGRDSPPRSALKSLEALERFLLPNEVIATLSGRFYAMDRKKSWERTAAAYEAMTLGRGRRADSPQAGITSAYNADVTDEFIEPIVLYHRGRMVHRIKNNDAVIFFNLRSDRARQLAKPFVQKDFEKKNPGAIKRKKVLKNLAFVAMTDFGPDLDSILSAYPSSDVVESLPKVLQDKRQLYLAEAEKYAHVTFFFNGGYADPVDGEERFKIESPQVTSYDRTPAMSTGALTRKLLASIKKYDFICVNFACPDMVGHTGNLAAGIKAVEAVDRNLQKIVETILKNNAILLITADHGNIERMFDVKTKEIVTEHTNNQVPLIMVGNNLSGRKLRRGGKLADVAPTILKIFGIKKSRLMTGKSLF